MQAFLHCGRVSFRSHVRRSLKIDASSDVERDPAVRQTLFAEFQQIEWQARVEAIRERLDQQRADREEQEREQERADRQAEEQEQVAEQAGVFADHRKRMTTTLQWHGDRLLPGEHCESHLVEFRNVIELDDSGAYRHPNDHANVALRNAVNEDPGGRAVTLLMLSLDRNLAADIQAKNGALSTMQ